MYYSNIDFNVVYIDPTVPAEMTEQITYTQGDISVTFIKTGLTTQNYPNAAVIGMYDAQAWNVWQGTGSDGITYLLFVKYEAELGIWTIVNKSDSTVTLGGSDAQGFDQLPAEPLSATWSAGTMADAGTVEIFPDGATPATARRTLPPNATDLEENTCYIIRRTSEEYAVSLSNGTNTTIENFLLIGMPKSTDQLYQLVPDEAKTAWGADTAEYANIECNSTFTSLVLPNMAQFALHRVYLFRNNQNSDNWLLNFDNNNRTNSSYNHDIKLCSSFEHCKFGYKGHNIDQAGEITSAISDKMSKYVYLFRCRVFNFYDNIVNTNRKTNDEYAFRCYAPDFVNVDKVKVYSLMKNSNTGNYTFHLSSQCENYYDDYDLMRNGYEFKFTNVTQEIVFNGGNSEMPELLSFRGFDNVTVKNINVYTRESTSLPSNFYVRSYDKIIFEYPCSFEFENINFNLPQCCRCERSLLRIQNGNSGSSSPGIQRTIRNITMNFGEVDNDGNKLEGVVGSLLSRDNVTNSSNRSNYAALHLYFYSGYDYYGSGYVHTIVPIVDNITINNPCGIAAYFQSVRVTNAKIKGAVTSQYSACDIEELSTWFPNCVLWAYYGSTVRVKKLIVNKENTVYPFSLVSSGAIQTGTSDYSFVFVDDSNAKASFTGYTGSTDRQNKYALGCANDGEVGHFSMKWYNGIADTWNIYRSNSGNLASLRFTNNQANTMNTMIIGQKPFRGMLLTSNYAGNQVLKMYFAFKAFLDNEYTELYRRFFVSITQKHLDGTEKVYWSNLCGRWVEDNSTWVNDSDLVKKRLEIPIETQDGDSLDIRIYYCLYSINGYFYLDPTFELEPIS